MRRKVNELVAMNFYWELINSKDAFIILNYFKLIVKNTHFNSLKFDLKSGEHYVEEMEDYAL